MSNGRGSTGTCSYTRAYYLVYLLHIISTYCDRLQSSLADGNSIYRTFVIRMYIYVQAHMDTDTVQCNSTGTHTVSCPTFNYWNELWSPWSSGKLLGYIASLTHTHTHTRTSICTLFNNSSNCGGHSCINVSMFGRFLDSNGTWLHIKDLPKLTWYSAP